MVEDIQLQTIRDAFDLYDADGSGIVKPKDLIATFIKCKLD